MQVPDERAAGRVIRQVASVGFDNAHAQAIAEARQAVPRPDGTVRADRASAEADNAC
jgi:hypothetical protein